MAGSAGCEPAHGTARPGRRGLEGLTVDATTISAVGSALTALVALVLSVEVRLSDRPRLRIAFDERAGAVFGPTTSRDFVPESVHTTFLVYNAGRRPSVVEEITCRLTCAGRSTELLNASSAIYKTFRLPLTVPSESAERVELAWILGKGGDWAQYASRFSLLPEPWELLVEARVITGKTFTRRYSSGDLDIVPFDLASQYQDALRPDVDA